MKLLNLIASIAMTLIAGQAMADASAIRHYICPGEYGGAYYSTGMCGYGPAIGDRVIVSITPNPEDAGRQGAFYIGTRTNGMVNGMFVALTTSDPSGSPSGNLFSSMLGIGSPDPAIPSGSMYGQWRAWQGGLFEPALMLNTLGSATRTFVVIDRALICTLAGSGQSELWAGYGILDDRGQMMLDNFHSIANPRITREHLQRLYIQTDMTKNQKAWQVLSENCTGYAGGGGF